MHTNPDLIHEPMKGGSRGGDEVPGVSALPVLVFVLTSCHGTSWEHEFVDRLRVSGICKAMVRELEPGDHNSAIAVRPSRDDAAQRDITAIVDLTGRLGAECQADALVGVWRVCDRRGVVLGDKHHGLETIAAGVGIQLHLVASTSSGTILIDKAGAFACPGECVSMQRLCDYAATLLLSAVREIAVLGALAPRPMWIPEGKRSTSVQRIKWKARELWNRALRFLKDGLLVD